MNLILELTDEDVAGLREALRISTADMKVIASTSREADSETRLQYARRIVVVRHILGMGNHFDKACYDYVKT